LTRNLVRLDRDYQMYVTPLPELKGWRWDYIKAEAWVYFIRSGEAGLIKIGTATNLRSRLASLQTGSPESLFLLGKVEVTRTDALASEHELHNLFRRSRVRGEWFRPTPELLLLLERLSFCDELGDAIAEARTNIEKSLLQAVQVPS
jgi:hypothetical protein